MAGPDSFMPLFIGDYLADTSHLDTTEHGAYLLLLFFYWRKGGPVADSDMALANITKRTPKQWTAIADTMRAFFRSAVIDGVRMLVHDRVERELLNARGKYESRKAASERANEAKAAALERLAKNRGGNLDGDRDGDPHGVPIGDRNGPTTTTTTTIKKVVQKEVVAPLALPAWMPLETWNSFLQTRKKITPRAVDLLIRELSKLKEGGDDPKEVLERSIMNGWKGLFPLKKVNGNGSARQESSHEQTERIARELIAELNARDAAGDHDRDCEAGNSLPRVLTYEPGIAPGVDRDAVPGFGPQVPRRASGRG